MHRLGRRPPAEAEAEAMTLACSSGSKLITRNKVDRQGAVLHLADQCILADVTHADSCVGDTAYPRTLPPQLGGPGSGCSSSWGYLSRTFRTTYRRRNRLPLMPLTRPPCW